MATAARMRESSSVFFPNYQSHYRDRGQKMAKTGHHSILRDDQLVVEPVTAKGQPRDFKDWRNGSSEGSPRDSRWDERIRSKHTG